jgi:6-phosphogluconolactonase
MTCDIHLREFESVAVFNNAVRALLCGELQRETGPNAVIISGGRTPLPIFGALAADPCPVAPKAFVAFSDERHVHADSPDSNFGGARPMLESLGLPEERILRVDTALSLDEAANDYDRQWAAFLNTGGTISTALLGVGTDGHTCSLFTEADLAAAGNRLAVAVRRPKPPHRVSVTPELLKHAERVVFLAAGAEKAAVVRQFLSEPGALVAGRAVAGHPRVEVWRA